MRNADSRRPNLGVDKDQEKLQVLTVAVER